MSTDRIGVLGGGLAGLTAACTLAARGYAVTLFERNSWVGGKACVWEKDGFRFDMGPTILTLPEVLHRVFGEAGIPLEQRLDLRRLDPQWRCMYDDGSVLDLVENVSAMQQSIGRYSKNPADVEGYRRFIDLSERLHQISEQYFFWRSVGNVWDIMDKSAFLKLSSLKSFLDMKPGKTVSNLVRSHVQDARVAQMLDHFVQYVGSSPEASPAVLCSIAHMQTNNGVWYPMGGTAAVPRALEKLARELGVDIRTDTGITRINHDGNKVTGVETSKGEKVDLAAVISNADAVRTHRELIGGDLGRKFDGRRQYEPACSGVVLYLGLDKVYDQLLHHDFIFSRDPEEEFDAIYHKGEPAPDPTCYIAAPQRTEPGVAPPGCDAVYVLVHTPYLRPHHDWKLMLAPYRAKILDKLKRTAGMKDIEDHIVVESTLTPQDIHDRYSVLNGAIYGLASHGRLHGAFKPANRSSDLQGLYLAGGAAHPGPGMPMVMMSGWIAADTLHQDKVVAPREPVAAAKR
jgi:phytoene desaturase